MAEVALIAKTYSDAAYVEGVAKHNPRMEQALFDYCKAYYDTHYKSVSYVGEEYRGQIFEESFVTLWNNILKKKIYAEGGVLKGRGGEAFIGKLTTYFMSIVRLKSLELENTMWHKLSTSKEVQRRLEMEIRLLKELQYDDSRDVMLEIISSCISRAPKRCHQIVSKFYYEEKTLDDIMKDIPTFKSKDALKSRKHKCMKTIRESANSIYRKYLNQ